MKIILAAFGVLILFTAVVGFFLPGERSARRTSIIKADVEKVFAKVTDISNQGWRSQVGSVEVIDSTPGREIWVEKPKNGPAIKFRTRAKNQPTRFEIEIIDNPQLSGFWIGTFKPTAHGQTEVEFSEHVVVSGILPKLMSYAFFDVDKSVDTYLDDLKRAVE